MTTSPIATFSVHHLQYLSESSEVTQALPEFATESHLIQRYQAMSLIRALDHKAVNLQRTGQMGTFPSSLGQEAVGVGTGAALAKDDVYCPYYRDHAALIQHGVELSEILAIWGGKEIGNHYQHENAKQDFPLCVPIATQSLHATGVAYAIQYRGEQRAVITTCGEGATSKGDFYEAMNLAGTWKLPVVFVVNNNQWAISVPRDQQTGSGTIAQKAIGAGFEGIQVDGNDVIATEKAVKDAAEKARSGGGPTLIEALTYRLCDHTTADDASRYRSAESLKAAWEKEPIARLGYYLESQGWWSKEKEATLQAACKEKVDQAVQTFLGLPEEPATAMFDSLYAELPAAYFDQYDALKGK